MPNAAQTPLPRHAGDTRYQRWGAGRARLLPHSSLVLPGTPGTNSGARDGHGYSRTPPSSCRGHPVPTMGRGTGTATPTLLPRLAGETRYPTTPPRHRLSTHTRYPVRDPPTQYPPPLTGPSTNMPRQTEPNANNALGSLLQDMMPRGHVRSENTQAISGKPGLRPDIIICSNNRPTRTGYCPWRVLAGMAARNCRSSVQVSLVSHSQTVTTLHPKCLSWAFCERSLSTFSSNLDCQNSRLLFGV